MKLIISLIACAVLSIPALAIAAPYDDTVVKVPASGVHGVYMSSADFKQFKGAYSLSNGSVLVLSGRGREMTAQIDAQPPHRIVATSAHSFEAVGHRLALSLDISEPDSVRGQLEYVDESRGSVADIKEPEVIHVAMR
jgi:hypothetical protein